MKSKRKLPAVEQGAHDARVRIGIEGYLAAQKGLAECPYAGTEAAWWREGYRRSEEAERRWA